MNEGLIETLTNEAAQLDPRAVWGHVASIEQTTLRVAGLGGAACAGDGVLIRTGGDGGGDNGNGDDGAGDRAEIAGEIVSLDEKACTVYAYNRLTGVRIGDRAILQTVAYAAPSDAWLGSLVDPLERLPNGAPAPRGPRLRALNAAAPPAPLRRGFGGRMATGLNAFDTFLPICRGQRIGLFAAPGVGKSSLVASLATRAEADVVVVALIGERGREVRAFFDHVLTPEVRARTVVVAASSDEPAPLKRRAALLAMTAAEHFSEQGKNVLLLFDSLTRFADAHREIALAGGEPPSLRAYPPSTFQALSGLVERAGPGVGERGDITAVFSVLAAGGDMNEPVSDAVRGFLDGHVVMDRAIAERGRFPAIDILQSASRSLPDAASPDENAALTDARALLSAYRDGETMVKAGLYEKGANATLDRAVQCFEALDAFVARTGDGPEAAFSELSGIIGGKAPTETAEPKTA